jgi:hypothetical protein
MKLYKKLLILWFLLCIPSLFGLRGCGTSILINDQIKPTTGPYPVKFLQGCVQGATILLEYHAVSPDFQDFEENIVWHTVGTIHKDARDIYHRKVTWKILENKLPIYDSEKCEEIAIEKISYGRDVEINRALQKKDNELQNRAHNILIQRGNGNLTLRIKDPFSNNDFTNLNIYNDNIAEHYTPVSNYIYVVMFWPFAVIVDYVTFPIFLILPDQFIDG